MKRISSDAGGSLAGMRGLLARPIAFLALFALCAGCRSRPAVPILTWHSIADGGDVFTVPRAELAAQLDALRGRPTLSLHELLAGHQPARAVVLTFDDGDESAFTVALPELRKRGMRATFFVVTGWIADDEQHRHLENGVRALIWPEVRELRLAGMEIGSHSVDHARLPDLRRDRVREELIDSKRELERRLGAPIDLFAYPYNSLRGWVRDEVIAAGYRGAVAGEVHGTADPFRLYRIPVQKGVDVRAALERYR